MINNNKETELLNEEVNNYEIDYEMSIEVDTDNEDSNEDFLDYDEEFDDRKFIKSKLNETMEFPAKDTDFSVDEAPKQPRLSNEHPNMRNVVSSIKKNISEEHEEWFTNWYQNVIERKTQFSHFREVEESSKWFEKSIAKGEIIYYSFKDYNNISEVGFGAFSTVYVASWKNTA
ncbi:7735_t:CDS:2 [Funneliformis caledonium]|uniref:7735_t:CDS:1 n=1 Tax=Funneliformis caledonium TaxID=1117310 RepID=A0A9N9APN9_9GLOM|nr:7735_t:CDS:2 [Funneliformis caledonium]